MGKCVTFQFCPVAKSHCDDFIWHEQKIESGHLFINLIKKISKRQVVVVFPK